MIRPRRHELRLLAAGVLAIVLALSVGRSAGASSPLSLIISNIRDTSFTVSWLTNVEEAGQLQLIDGGSFEDIRGAGYHGITHYVTVSGLVPNTSYRFDLLSGGTRYDAEGVHWTIRTAAPLAPPMPDLILGRVKNPDGSDANNVIVVFTVEREREISAPLSMLVTASDKGFFHINLADLRDQSNPSHYFEYASLGDLLTIQAVNERGMGSVKVGLNDPRLRATDPAQALAIDLQAPGQTPTLVVRQPTPTPIPMASAPQSGGLWIGVGAAAVLGLCVIVVAVVFVWRH